MPTCGILGTCQYLHGILSTTQFKQFYPFLPFSDEEWKSAWETVKTAGRNRTSIKIPLNKLHANIDDNNNQNLADKINYSKIRDIHIKSFKTKLNKQFNDCNLELSQNDFVSKTKIDLIYSYFGKVEEIANGTFPKFKKVSSQTQPTGLE